MVDQLKTFFQFNKHCSCNHLPIHMFQNIISDLKTGATLAFEIVRLTRYVISVVITGAASFKSLTVIPSGPEAL